LSSIRNLTRIYILGRPSLAREGLAAFLSQKGFFVDCGETPTDIRYEFRLSLDQPAPDASWISITTGDGPLDSISLRSGPEALLARLQLKVVKEPRGLSTESKLSARELEIVRLVGQGLSNRDIAAMLELKEQSVKNLIYRSMKKESCANRTQLALRAKLAE